MGLIKTDRDPKQQDSGDQPSKAKKPTRHREKERIRQGVEQVLSNWGDNEQELPEDAPYSEEKVPLMDIRLDPDNHRTRHINEFDPLTNTLSQDHPDYKETQDLIEGLKVFAGHLKTQPMHYPIKVYQHKNKYFTGAGARRYLAMKIAHGEQALVKVWVYEKKPDNLNVTRFIENHQREDVSFIVTLMDFAKAVEALDSSKFPLDEKKAAELGISKTHFSKLSKISKNEILFEHFIKPRKVETLNDAYALAGCKTVEEMEERLELLKTGSSVKKAPIAPKKGTVGRRRSVVRVEPIRDMRVAKALVSGDIFKAVEWSEDDFEDPAAFQEKLDECLTEFKKTLV